MFGFVATAVIGAFVYGRSSTASAGDRVRAMQLADEGVQAATNIRGAAYANLVDGTYGLAQSGGQWVFSGTSDTSGVYTRQIGIATSGTNRKTITSTVTWPQAGGTTGTVTVTSRLTNWAVNLPVSTSWNNAILAGSADTGTNPAAKVKAVGNYSYTVLSGATNNLVIANISTPAAPSIVSTTTLPGTPTNIAISGNYAYITGTSDTAELQVVDISNPAVPTVVASVNMTGSGDGQGVFISGDYAYVTRSADTTSGANELTIVNITVPLAPVVTGGYSNNIVMYEVYVSGSYAYVTTASGSQEMLVVSVSNPASPTLAATYNPAGLVAGRTVSGFGNTVFVGIGTNLHALNVTTPTTPALLGTIAASGIVYDVEIDASQQFAFLATGNGNGEFQVINIATPSAMTQAKVIDLSGNSAMGGVGYDTALDVVAGAGSANTQEILVFTKN